jgi:hypothetical protein
MLCALALFINRAYRSSQEVSNDRHGRPVPRQSSRLREFRQHALFVVRHKPTIPG